MDKGSVSDANPYAIDTMDAPRESTRPVRSGRMLMAFYRSVGHNVG